MATPDHQYAGVQRITTQPRAVHLTEPAVVQPPKPYPGCDICGALSRQWRQATEAGGPAYDPSHAVDLAVEIRRHPHPKAGSR
ncbi:hypothetical protein ACFYYH_16110 [Streptomyces sp. NPDC002018]|uniref:hypothetical protein n=1 Tax=Streptomyces sp. NPDC002018 TaxID=3364629 RepID=UPI00369C409E